MTRSERTTMTACSREARPRAFSLLELVIVVAILGIVATVGMPRFAASVDRSGARAAAYSLAQFTEQTREEAMAAGDPRLLTIHPTTFDITAYDLVFAPFAVVTEEMNLSLPPFDITAMSATSTDVDPTDGTDEQFSSSIRTGRSVYVFNAWGDGLQRGEAVITRGSASVTVSVCDENGKTYVK